MQDHGPTFRLLQDIMGLLRRELQPLRLKRPFWAAEAAALYTTHTSARKRKILIKVQFKNPPRPILNPGQLLKLLKTGTEKEVKLPNLSSPPMKLVEKNW